MIKKVIIALLIVGVLAGAYVYFFMLHKSHPDYEQMDSDIKITAEKLYNDSKNGNAATYTGKLLEVNGTPSSLEVNDSLYILVYAFDEGMFGQEGVRATFLSHYNDKAQKISFDKEITIKAFCTGYNDTDVILEKASIVQP